MKKQFIATMASILLLFGSGHTLAVTQYTITDLGTLGGSQSYATGINNNGWVVGNSYVAGSTVTHAFLYNGTTMKDLGTLEGGQSYATGINDSGQVVGHSDTSTTGYAFLYDGTTMRNLGVLGGSDLYGRSSSAAGINDSGLVVGNSTVNGSSDTAAFLYNGTTMQSIGPFGARGINNSGWAVGDTWMFAYSNHACLYDGHLKDLGTLGGRNSIALGINDSGWVIGNSEIAFGSSTQHAFLYNGTTMTDIGALVGESCAWGINNSSQVVGSSNSINAFLYDGGNMINLNTLLPAGSGWSLTTASGINDLGQIVGEGSINGQHHAFLMTPAPEPASLLLFGLGGMVLRLRK